MLKELLSQPNVTINIKKAKLKEGTTLIVTFDVIKTATNTFISSFETKWPYDVSKDLVTAFNRLRLHMLILTETLSATALGLTDKGLDEKDYKLLALDVYRITGITISGVGDDEGIAISGVKKLQSKKAFNIHAPFTKLAQPVPEDGGYPYAEELIDDLNNCRLEIGEYLKGKYIENAQKELFEEEVKAAEVL